MALDLSGPKTPPPATKRATASKSYTAAKTAAREEGLNGLLQLGSALCLMLGQHADAGAIATHGPNIARETAGVAETNESFGKTLDYLTAVGPYAGLLTAVMPLGLQIAVNHGKLPAEPLSQFGVVAPEQLSQRIALDALRQEAAFAAEKAEFERELAELAASNGNAGKDLVL